MIFILLNIDFEAIFNGTIQILVFYIIFFSILVSLLLFSKKFLGIFDKLNKFHFTREDSMFKLNYLAIGILIAIIGFSTFIIGFRELRAGNYPMFALFAIFAFYILPLALGFLGIYAYIIGRGEYYFGSAVLLVISTFAFASVGSNLHDVLWCGVATKGYTTTNLAGDDLYLWFVAFGITDRTKTDYRIFGFYMFLQVIIEITVGTIAFYQYYKLNKKYINIEEKRPFILAYIALFSAGISLGIVEFIFDYPWIFTDLEYILDVYIGIPIIAFAFFLIGFYLGKNNKAR